MPPTAFAATLRRSRTVPAEGAAPSQIRPSGSPVDIEAAAARRTVAQNVPLRRRQAPRTDHGRTPVIRGIFCCSEVHRFLNRGEGGLVWCPPSLRYPCFCCPVIVPFRSHEWDRLVSGWASNYHPDIGAGSIQGIRLVTAKVWDPSGSHFEVTTLRSASGDRPSLHGRELLCHHIALLSVNHCTTPFISARQRR